MERRRKEKEEGEGGKRKGEKKRWKRWGEGGGGGRDEKYRVEMREEGDKEMKNGSGGTSSALGWHTLHSTVSPMCYSAIPRSKLHRPPFCMNPDTVLGEVMPSSLWSYLHDEWHVHSQLLLLQKLSY